MNLAHQCPCTHLFDPAFAWVTREGGLSWFHIAGFLSSYQPLSAYGFGGTDAYRCEILYNGRSVVGGN